MVITWYLGYLKNRTEFLFMVKSQRLDLLSFVIIKACAQKALSNYKDSCSNNNFHQ